VNKLEKISQTKSEILATQKHFKNLATNLEASENNKISLNKSNNKLAADNEKLVTKLEKISQTKSEILSTQKQLTDALKLANQKQQTSNKEHDESEKLKNDKIFDLQAEIQGLIEENRTANEKLTITTQEIFNLTQEKSKTERIKNETDKTLENHKSKITILESDKSKVEVSEKKLKLDLDMAQNRLNELEQILDSTKNSNQKLQSEVYSSRSETQQIHLRENQLKKEIKNMSLKFQENFASFEEEKRKLVVEITGCKQRKGETEFDAIRRTFTQTSQNLKRLNLFKKDVSIKISELPESETKLEDLDVIKTLNQTKLELTRLRNTKKRPVLSNPYTRKTSTFADLKSRKTRRNHQKTNKMFING